MSGCRLELLSSTGSLHPLGLSVVVLEEEGVRLGPVGSERSSRRGELFVRPVSVSAGYADPSGLGWLVGTGQELEMMHKFSVLRTGSGSGWLGLGWGVSKAAEGYFKTGQSGSLRVQFLSAELHNKSFTQL